MNFQICDPYSFWWPVTVHLPDPDKPGELSQQDFEGKFLMTSHEQLAELEAQGQEQLISSILTDWRNVEDAGGNPVLFSEEALGQCLPYQHFRIAVYRAYLSALTGQAARAKN
ncbi:hypothetical protein [Labrenzia sp. PHM005]|uniref:hypothetical protein n=1 Tax=Labrenzia sp. PHM005 TaxID=2590016 RepID=UPI00113FF512|nr:hypothetical protein [Labrenzia sp. PHM005]QDG74455.1 hypothetical protein FJ695_00395 [Labrenzia sp. PHM005]